MDKTVPPLKIWITAVRPFAFTGSALAVALGAALAFYDGAAIGWGSLLLTLLGVVLFQSGANLLNDCFDHRRGVDTEAMPTSGAVVRGWLTGQEALRAGWLCLALGAACGLVLTALAGWPVLALGVVGTALAAGYTTAGFSLKYAGLGDLSVFLAFGMLPVFGAYWVQARAWAWHPLLWSLPIVSLTVGILHANNWRDLVTDPARRCRTVANLLGERGAERYYRFLVLAPYALVLSYVAAGRAGGLALPAPWTVLAVLVSLPLAGRLLRVNRMRDPKRLAMLDGLTAQLHLVFSLLLAAAFVVARLCGW